MEDPINADIVTVGHVSLVDGDLTLKTISQSINRVLSTSQFNIQSGHLTGAGAQNQSRQRGQVSGSAEVNRK